ncbi:hypothetical protein PFISCL1PPCAC_27062 [Pristionchus fissidentatus]|uniref:Calcineurin-like phosphoesterase domain-containing protein n=1 Tax=Pristionchus fissidentatus TaxID=1538716 RepID=A0AAV5WWA6_9BILA|nr:hypothetical protein PFISCL1PPCAC_27062 [Pristionchus fissidentatus]
MNSGFLLLLLIALIAVANGQDDSEPEVFSKDELAIIVMGDPQFHFMCEMANPPCKEASRRCMEAVAQESDKPASSNARHPTTADCIAIESRYANRIQRTAMESLIGSQRYPPAGLVIDGDLTDFGHNPQLEEFKTGWMKNFPIPIFPGLGNHDYQNNINDCALNICARTMLNWYIHFAANKSLPIQFNSTSYTGSLAYTKRLCSLTGKNCAQVVQMNNAIDYEVAFTAFFIENWRIESGFAWLKRQLELWKDDTLPILINVHQNEDAREEKLKQLLGDWIYENRGKAIKRKIGVFFAHMHARHEVKTVCLHGVSVPFVYVGSVPNNRFTVLRFFGDSSGDRISGYAARERGAVLLDSLDDIWDAPCNRSFIHHFHERRSNSFPRFNFSAPRPIV